MGSKHSQEDILEAAVAISIEQGIGALSFGRVAKRMKIPDRTVVYYFARKDDLIAAVIDHHNAQLAAVLSRAFTKPVSSHKELLRTAWPVMTSTEADVAMRIFLEMIGLAARGLAPYDTIVPTMLEAWVDLLVGLVDLPEDARRAEAEAAVALIDGLLLLRHMLGEEAAERAAKVHMR